MSVSQPKTIDASGISKDDGRIILNIFDPLPFDGEERLRILQSKINDYLDFVDSGQVSETYPAAASNQIEIHVWFRFAPDPKALAFLSAAKVTLADAGLLFAYTHQAQSDPTTDADQD
jgi:hypothetical protein